MTQQPASFIIYALPRSRTTWLSAFLSYGGWTCKHDAAGEMDSLTEIVAWLAQPKRGICETALGFAARSMYRLCQEARVAVVRRDLGSIKESISRQSFTMPQGWAERAAAELDRAAAIPGALAISYEELGTEAGAAAIFEHCLQRPFDREWWTQLAGRRIETDFAMAVQTGRNRAGIFADMIAEADRVMEMPTVQNEPWDSFFADAKPLFAEHYAEAGPMERLEYNPNFGLAARAYKLGMLQITTARAHGRLVGYLLCQVEQHLEDQGTLRGIQIPFFIRRAYRGPLALKMHRFMRQSLAARGVKVLTVRSGIRAAGLRQDALFRFLRAKPDGHMFTMMIGDG